MSVASVLLPAFVQVGLVFVLLFVMGRARFAAAKAGRVKVGEAIRGDTDWPLEVRRLSGAYHNQFELPPLFLLLVALALFTRKADLLFVVMSWVFVIARIGHAFVFATTNVVLRRFQVFMVGAVVLLLMWAIFAVRILFAA